MTGAPSRPANYLPPRVKSISTPAAALSSNPASRPSTPAASRFVSRQIPSLDPLSDKTTTSLIRRVLCPATADKNALISDLLPPLTSSNDVDLQLYAFIAIVIKEFVYTWYGKITPDQTFVEEVVRIIAHCTRGLEGRLRKVDLEALLFDELPELLETHIKAYQVAYTTAHPPPLESDPRLIYHSQWPTPALFPVPQKNDPASVLIQRENEAAYRQLLIQGVLSILLPTEDLENDCLTSLVGQIFSEMILGKGLGDKACEPWMLWEGFTKIAEVIKAQLPKSRAQQRMEKSRRAGSGAETKPSSSMNAMKRRRWSPKKTFWIIVQYIFLVFSTFRFMIVTIATSSSLPSRSSRLPPSWKLNKSAPVKNEEQPPDQEDVTAPFNTRVFPAKQPILAMSIWPCVSTLLDLNVRMPWMGATFSMLQWLAVHGPGEVGNTDGTIDKLLSHALQTHILDASRLPLLLRTARSALFPLNAPAPPRAIPSAPEALQIRRRCAIAILDLVPLRVQYLYFGRRNRTKFGSSAPAPTALSSPSSEQPHLSAGVGSGVGSSGVVERGGVGHGSGSGSGNGNEDEEELEKARRKTANEAWREGEAERRIGEVEEVLNCFGDAYANKHLVYGLVEIIILRLMPELGEKGVQELLSERLN